ncbi:MAG: hypothetical protein H0T73_07035 [Ardenticatenales bacterium]|nr:hypothetical protein [Ardenticatenales bacterium]
MHLDVSTHLDCSPAAAWREVQSSRLLQHIAFPLVGFEPLDPPHLPVAWEPGRYRVRLKLGMLLPLGAHDLNLSVTTADSTSGQERYEVRDNGAGGLISRWDHRITIVPDPRGGTLYSDQVEVQAGALTLFAWGFAWLFYHYRQWRWRQLVQNQFAYDQGGGSMKEVMEKELRVAFSRGAQPVWFRVLKWVLFISLTVALRRSATLRVWLLGGPLVGLVVHFIYRWKTAAWTQPWGGWEDLAAAQDDR